MQMEAGPWNRTKDFEVCGPLAFPLRHPAVAFLFRKQNAFATFEPN
jgi:hypothetical protein